jgi:hypothetical protein
MTVAKFSLDVTGNDDFQPFVSGAADHSLANFSNYLRSVFGGARTGDVTLKARHTQVAASGTITLATCLTGSVIEVNGVPFTAITSGTPIIANGEFVISGTDNADAVSLAAAINGSTNAAVSGIVTAAAHASTGVVTITAIRPGYFGNALTIVTKGVVAQAEIKPTTVLADDTVTLNGTTLTAKQQRATATLTAATAIAGNTFSVQGYTFTGAAGASTAGALTFSIDTSDTACGADIVKQINSFGGLSGVVTASSAAGVVTVRAVSAGTAGNSIALTGTTTTLEASAAALAGGIAVANNQFEAIGNDIQIAADLARCINASSTAGVNLNARALTTTSATIIASSVDAGDACTIHVGGLPYTFTAVAGAVATGTLSFSKDTGNTETGASLAAQINAYPVLLGLVSASASAGTVTLKCLTSAAALSFSITTTDGTDLAVATAVKGSVKIYSKIPGTLGNAITIASSGATLPITSSLARLGGGTALSYEGTAATGTLTLTTTLNAHTCAVNGVTITAHTNTQANDQFTIAGSDDEDATALALAINNSTTAGLKEVFATAATNVVTVTARRAGLAGNNITLVGGQSTIVANVARLATGAAPITIVMSGDRLASGSETALTFSY